MRNVIPFNFKAPVLQLALLFVAVGFPQVISAQELHQDLHSIWQARVIEVVESGNRTVPGTDVRNDYQILRAEILEGSRKGEVVEFENDFFMLEEGDKFFLNYIVDIDGRALYSVREPDRRSVVLIFSALFAAVILVFGKMQGLRALISLGVSFSVIMFLLLPQLLAGSPPVPTSIGYAMLILGLVMFITHGFSRATVAAFLGTVASIIVTGVLAFLAVDLAALSGFVSDESVYLNLSTRGTLDLSGLLLGAFIIGVLGLLDDIAITQASAVEELSATDRNLARSEVVRRALRIGKEHVGALVNTLALAYAGASLPLLLLFSMSDASFGLLINREIVAAEILRTAIGGIGLVLTVPFSTWFAGRLLVRERTSEESLS